MVLHVVAWASTLIIKAVFKNSTVDSITGKIRDLFFMNVPYVVFIFTSNEMIIQVFLQFNHLNF